MQCHNVITTKVVHAVFVVVVLRKVATIIIHFWLQRSEGSFIKTAIHTVVSRSHDVTPQHGFCGRFLLPAITPHIASHPAATCPINPYTEASVQDCESEIKEEEGGNREKGGEVGNCKMGGLRLKISSATTEGDWAENRKRGGVRNSKMNLMSSMWMSWRRRKLPGNREQPM